MRELPPGVGRLVRSRARSIALIVLGPEDPMFAELVEMIVSLALAFPRIRATR